MEVRIDGATVEPDELGSAVEELLDALVGIDAEGWYPAVDVVRPWSVHNPRITGEFARPTAVRRYLQRELTALLSRGAVVSVRPSRKSLTFSDPGFFAALEEDRFDLRAKKLFLFGPERMALSLERLAHYCGTPAESFERHVVFTNYAIHVDAFRERFPDSEGPAHTGIQMPAWHCRTAAGDGVSLVNIGVGPSNAKTLTDHLAVLRPDTMIMIGHCGGLRNHQQLGDFVLATSYLRADHVLDDVLPATVPVIPNLRLNSFLLHALEERQARFRTGVVYTTDNRNWEFNQRRALDDIRTARCVAVDMESATIAANGFRYRIPNATLLCVSDKPLHGEIKLPGQANRFYEEAIAAHLAIGTTSCELLREQGGRLHSRKLRAFHEPPFR